MMARFYPAFPVLFAVLALLNTSASRPLAHVGDGDVLPLWHTQFRVSFNETTRIIFKRTTAGMWWYDTIARAEVFIRDDGNGDRYCGSIHPIMNTACRHVVVRGKRYLLFPELGECCMCCTDEQGCGVLSPTWLDDAHYEGEVDINRVRAYKWTKRGLQPNAYYATADEYQIPVQLDQVPNDLMTFHVDTFELDPIDPQLLVIPEDCHTRCPISSVCTIAQHEREGGWMLRPVEEAGGAAHAVVV